MIHVTFFLGCEGSSGALAEVAAQVFQALAISESEERFSANYPPNEHYFAGYTKNASMKIYDSDDDRMPDFPFCLSIDKPTFRVGKGEIATDSRVIARLLTKAGLKVFLPTGHWYRADWDGDGELYLSEN